MNATDPAPQRHRVYLETLQSFLDSPGSDLALVTRTLVRQLRRLGGDAPSLAPLHEKALVALAPAQNLAALSAASHLHAIRFLARSLLAMMEFAPTAKMRTRSTAPDRRTQGLLDAASLRCERRLEREVARREASEKAVKAGEARFQQLSKQSTIMQTRLRSLAHRILQAQEEERREISRELHDEIVQSLVGINVELAALDKAASAGTRAFKAKIASTQRLVEKSVTAVHQFARDLRPAVLDDLGLIPALKAMMKTISSRHHLPVRLTAFVGVESLPESHRLVLYRVAQEALTNVGRHAKASLVRVSIRRVPGAIRMDIHDNGKSFHVSRILSGRSNKRLGLIGMRERVEMVGGHLAIESSPGEGTTVRADIPFAPEGTS